MNSPAGPSVITQICLHCRDEHSGPSTTAIRDVRRIPQAGDSSAVAPINIFRVVLTPHVLLEVDDDTGIFAEVIELHEVQNATIREEVWSG